jgi:hypothetical protein
MITVYVYRKKRKKKRKKRGDLKLRVLSTAAKSKVGMITVYIYKKKRKRKEGAKIDLKLGFKKNQCRVGIRNCIKTPSHQA